MRITKKLLALGLCITTCISLFTGCSSNKEMALVEESKKQELTFTWWGPDARNEYTIAAIKDFEKQNPNIKVNLEYSEFTGFQDKLNVKMSAHTEPDVMQLNYSWVSEFSPDGDGFYNLEDLSNTLDLSNYDEKVLEYGKINGKLNALPIAQNGLVFVYNEDIYKKYNVSLPKTWDDFFKAADAMKNDGIYPLDINNVAMWIMCVSYVEQTTGRQIIDDNGKLGFTLDDVKSMISFYCKLVNQKVAAEVSKRSDDDITGGKAACTVQWINSAQKAADMIKEAGGNAVIGNTPILSNASRSGWYVRPATMYAISKNSKNPEVAAKLLNFLVSSKEMALKQLLDKGIPFNKKAADILDKKNLLQGTMNDAAIEIENTETFLMNPKFEDASLSDAFYNAAISVIYGESNLNKAASETYNAFKDVLK